MNVNDCIEIFKKYQAFDNPTEYFMDQSYSYSKIKDCYNYPEALFKDYKKTSVSMDIGSAVDIHITNPKEISKIRIISKMPSDTNKKIADYILFTYPEHKEIDSIPDEVIAEAYNKVSPNNRWTAPVQRKKFVEDSIEYYKERADLFDCVLLTPDLNDRVMKIVETLRTNKLTARYCGGEEETGLVVFSQYSVKYVINGITYKSLFDFLAVDTLAMVAYVIDLKVGENDFLSSMTRFKWYYQASMYYNALVFLLKKVNSDLCDDKNKASSLVPLSTLPFRFLHVNINKPNVPTFYTVPNSLERKIRFDGFSNGFYHTPPLTKVFNAVKYYNDYIRKQEKIGNDISLEDIPTYEHYLNAGHITLDYE